MLVRVLGQRLIDVDDWREYCSLSWGWGGQDHRSPCPWRLGHSPLEGAPLPLFLSFIGSGLTAALLTVFDSVLNPNPSCSACRCLSLASYSSPSSVYLKLLPNISISRTSRFPLPTMPRTIRTSSIASSSGPPCTTTRT